MYAPDFVLGKVETMESGNAEDRKAGSDFIMLKLKQRICRDWWCG